MVTALLFDKPLQQLGLVKRLDRAVLRHRPNDVDAFSEPLDVHALFFTFVFIGNDDAVEDEIVTVECNKRGAVVVSELSEYHC
ncbi:hypothetical protein [Haloferax volcanii]|uniref:hypothetical protein n=1 Tax=Haloferax volcanii TaxID=2246 RepID=UPI0006779F0B|nr:hypothetical protein [Haloferax alexandrinus]